ncbi:hypothetical protein BD414DRAFT_474575 [Trametes punicea]|nr:hypothetical protein BD414DRAFT_474575 [Trametes punicea]
MSSSTSGSSSESERASSSSSPPPHKRQRLSEDETSDESESETTSDDSSEGESELDEEAPVLSHAEKRRQKKKEQRATKRGAPSIEEPEKEKGKVKVKNTAELPPSKIPKRQNSVWVGNLSFKTSPAALRTFFDGVGEITRIHMPMKMVSGGPGDKRPRQENRGFAYVDFATPDAKAVAITLSERPLDGRRLLIKDGDDFNGRPTTTNTLSTDDAQGAAPKSAGLTKTAQKILKVQKQPPGPTLFFGNLGFETTESSIRELLDSHRPKSADEKWIRKVRMGTFEDSGKCKGWAFVDFTNTEHATAALTNPSNHQLDGRKLVVEYASPEAVRRGGGGPPRTDKGQKGRKGQKGQKSPGKRDRSDHAEGAADDAETDSRPTKKRRTDDGDDADAGAKAARGKKADSVGKGGKGGKGPRPRAKPGAALAQAKREDVAIVPSQGKKIVFS